MTGFMATEEVSLNGSPTVSPTMVASCSSVPFILSSVSTSFLALIPCAAGIGHEDGLVQTEDGDADEVANEEIVVQAGESQGGEEDAEEDVEHPLLGVLRADLDDFFRVFTEARSPPPSSLMLRLMNSTAL